MAYAIDTTLLISVDPTEVEFYDQDFPAITFKLPNPEIAVQCGEFIKYILTLQYSILTSLYPKNRRSRGRISYMKNPIHKKKWIRALTWSEYVISEVRKMNLTYSEMATDQSEFRQGSATQRDYMILLNERLNPDGAECQRYFEGCQDDVLFGQNIDWNRLEAQVAQDSYTASSYELINQIAPLLGKTDEQLKVMREDQIHHYMRLSAYPRFDEVASGIMNEEELATRAKLKEEQKRREREMRSKRTRGIRTDPGFLRVNKGQGDSVYQSGSGSQGSEEEKKPPTCSHQELLSSLLGHLML